MAAADQLLRAMPHIDGAAELERALEDQCNTVVTGSAAGGVLAPVLRAAERCPVDVAVVDATACRTDVDVIDRLARTVSAARVTAGRRPGELMSPGSALTAEIARLTVDEPVTVVVHGLDDPDLALDVFGGLRDELWSTRLCFVVVCSGAVASALGRPPCAAMFDSHIVLRALR